MSLFPRADGFSPIFRLLDDYDAHRSSRGSNSRPAFSNLSPRFDVRESKDAYLLDGEIPGISPKDVDIEFSDHQTLVIKGRVHHEYSSGSNDDDGTNATSPKPTVEDAPEEGEGSSSQKVAVKSKSSAVSKSSTPQYKFWVNERSFGEFHRSFSFPTRVDQDNVKATCKNGVLSVVIPKAPHPAARKITIE